METRSGENQFHGSMYEYFENSAMNARNFFDGRDKPRSTQHQFGASLGGPVRANRWFFFADSEITRERRGLTVVSTVPSVEQKRPATSRRRRSTIPCRSSANNGVYLRQPLAGNRVPESRISTAARNLMNLYPDPNLAGAVNNYLSTPTLSANDTWAGVFGRDQPHGHRVAADATGASRAVVRLFGRSPAREHCRAISSKPLARALLANSFKFLRPSEAFRFI